MLPGPAKFPSHSPTLQPGASTNGRVNTCPWKADSLSEIVEPASADPNGPHKTVTGANVPLVLDVNALTYARKLVIPPPLLFKTYQLAE